MFPVDELSEQRAADQKQVSGIRDNARRRFDAGDSGFQIAQGISQSLDEVLKRIYRRVLAGRDSALRRRLQKRTAVIAVGGSGRGELAPYSDVDLLFLSHEPLDRSYKACVADVVRDCWDAGMKLGHSVRSWNECLNLAIEDATVATSLVEARLLDGHRRFFHRFRQQVFKKVVRGRAGQFVDDCIQSRQNERMQHGCAVQQLEPDIKRSLGGLRDLHLMRWVAYAHYDSVEIDDLRAHDALTDDDAQALRDAQEFLTRLRIDLHLNAGRVQDMLTREEQLRISEQRRIPDDGPQRSVERFMQTYFQHSQAIANISSQFVAIHQPRPLTTRITESLVSRRTDGIFWVGPETVDVAARHRDSVCHDPEAVLKLFRAAAHHKVTPAPWLLEQIKQSVDQFPAELSEENARLFMEIMRGGGHLGPTLRLMYETGVLEYVVPPMAHARCLLQFNHYHCFTVDEHTLLAVESAEELHDDQGPLGTAYRAIQDKDLLHLALLLHDLGKGFEEDHSEVGRRIAEDVGRRLRLADDKHDTLVFLVHRHLKMAHLAFRRDISDPDLLMPFSDEVRSPERLRLLYVLTAADIMAVGPGRWTDWKGELLGELFDRAMAILSDNQRFQEEQGLEQIKDDALVHLLAAAEEHESDGLKSWAQAQLDALPPHYLTELNEDQIAADLLVIRLLATDAISINGTYDAETGTMEYSVITDSNFGSGCFHRIAGVLAARRLEILAQIITSLEGTVVDRFRVRDSDFADDVPDERIAEIGHSIRQVLLGDVTVEELFRRHKRFAEQLDEDPISDLPTRVSIDNDTSDSSTIIEVFAHDRPGLLYTIARKINGLGLSVELAKISTHFDQVLDVFYVTDSEGKKIDDGDGLKRIQQELADTIASFERDGRMAFVS